MAIRKIRLRRGLESQLPTLDVGEPGFTTDTKKFFIGSATGNIEYPSLTAVQTLIDNLDLSEIEGLATETFVTNTISAIEIPSVEGLATTEYVDQAIAGVEAGNVNLEGYATETFVTEAIGLTNLFNSSAPTSSIGQLGDTEGMMAVDNQYLYRCVANYPGKNYQATIIGSGALTNKLRIDQLSQGLSTLLNGSSGLGLTATFQVNGGQTITETIISVEFSGNIFITISNPWSVSGDVPVTITNPNIWARQPWISGQW